MNIDSLSCTAAVGDRHCCYHFGHSKTHQIDLPYKHEHDAIHYNVKMNLVMVFSLVLFRCAIEEFFPPGYSFVSRKLKKKK